MIRPTSGRVEKLKGTKAKLQPTLAQSPVAHSGDRADLNRYQELFALAPDGYVVTDRHGRIKEANIAVAKILNTEHRYLINKPLVVYADPDSRTRLFGLMQELLTHDLAEATVRVVPRGAKAHKIIQARITADRFDGEPPHTLRWLLRDVTRQEHQHRHSQERQREMASKIAMVEEQERRRLALLIHDNITQSLALAQLRLGMLGAELMPGHSQTIDEIRADLAQTVAQLRTLTFELSPAVLYDLGLGAALEWLIEKRSGCGVELEFRDDLDGRRFRQEIEITLFQAARELIANILRHSHATRAALTLQVEAGQLVMEVIDNGIGFDTTTHPASSPAQSGLGLPSLRERVSHLRGNLEIVSNPGGGTRIRLTMPLTSQITNEIQTEQLDATSSAYRGRSSDLPAGPALAVGEGGRPGRNGGGRRRPGRPGNNGDHAG